MSNKIKSTYRIKNIVLEKQNENYKFINELNKQELCSINLPSGVFLNQSLSNKELKIRTTEEKKLLPKDLKKKLGFLSNFFKENLNITKKIIVRRISLVGTGFKVFNNIKDKGDAFILKIGFSHLINVKVPTGITFTLIRLNEIKFISYDKELLGSFLNYVVNFRLPDSYKGRGLIISNKRALKLKKGKVKS